MAKMVCSGFAIIDSNADQTYHSMSKMWKRKKSIRIYLCRRYLEFLKINRWVYDPKRGIPIDTRNPQKTYAIEKGDSLTKKLRRSRKIGSAKALQIRPHIAEDLHHLLHLAEQLAQQRR